MKYFIYSIFSILILISMIIIICINDNYNIDNYKNNPEFFKFNNIRYLSDKINKNKNETKFDNYSEYFRQFKKTQNFFDGLEKRLKEQLFDGEVNYTNIPWNNTINNTNANITKNGLMIMRIFLPYDRDKINLEQYPIFKFKILENKTLDNLILISIVNSNNSKYNNIYKYSYINEKYVRNITLNDYNESFLNISYNSKVEKNHYFNSIPYYIQHCNFQYNLYFINNNKTLNISNDNNIKNRTNINNTNTNNIIEIEGMTGTLYSHNCKIKMEFNLKKHSYTINELYNRIIAYSIISVCLSLFHLINTKLFIKKIDLSMVNLNSICVFTICQNIIWNCYCCYNHFFLLINFLEYKFCFSIIFALNFINFGYIEFPLLYQLLSLKYSHLINDVLSYRKKIIQFCILFYITILFSFLFVMKCFYSPPFIIFSFVITWLPQILFNIYYKNRVSFPIIYIIGVLLNRIFPSFYFNYYENNFLRIPLNRDIVIKSISILLILTIILYSQSLFGPRWFLFIIQNDEYDFFIDEKDLRILKKDLDNLECLICLNPIIENKQNNNVSIYDNAAGFNETDHLVIDVNDNSSLNDLDNNKSKGLLKYCCRFKYKDRCIGENSIIFNFHEFSKNIMNKPFMITPCMHVFHSECLEEWFKMKKECPNCRTMITQDMYN